MNRRFVLCLALSLLIIAACRPIRPESEVAPTIEAASEITSTTTITTSGIPFGGGGVDGAPGDSPSSQVRQRVIPTATPTHTSIHTSTIAAGDITSCPAITDKAIDVEVLAHWVAGEQRLYEIHKSRTDLIADQEYVAFESSTPITITVTEANDDGYHLAWQFGVPAIVDIGSQTPSPLEAPFLLPPDVVLTYSTDSAGAFIGVTNQEEIQQEVLLIFEQFLDELIASGEFPPQTIDGSRERVTELIEDPTNFELLFTQEIALFHTLYGHFFNSTEPVIVPDLRPNLLGGAPIPSEMNMTPTHFSADQGCLFVTFENVADPQATRNSILQALQDQAKQLGVPGPDEDDLPPEIELNDSISFEMDLASGWPLSIFLKRSIMLGTQGRIEVTEILPVPD